MTEWGALALMVLAIAMVLVGMVIGILDRHKWSMWTGVGLLIAGMILWVIDSFIIVAHLS